MVIGIGSAFLLAILTDKGGTYKKYIIICIVGNIVGLSIMIFSLAIDDKVTYVFDAGIVIFGMFLMPIIPLTFQMGCELNFELNAKVGEANVVGVILAFGKLNSLYTTYTFFHTFLVKKKINNNPRSTNIASKKPIVSNPSALIIPSSPHTPNKGFRCRKLGPY